jgi:MFS family permease
VTRPAHDAAPLRWLEHAFFLSGIAALTYQVAWERVLFVIFGINTEAVTVVVTAFLLGLGVGSAVGGWISKRPGCRHLRWFCRCRSTMWSGASRSASTPSRRRR